VDLEVFYFNDTSDPAQNCDNSGPTFTSTYHEVDRTSNTVKWAVEVEDDDVWRVVVVYSELGQGKWAAVDLDKIGAHQWRGTQVFNATPHLDYVIQAVDYRGNVSWLDFNPDDLPTSGVRPEVPLVVEVKPD
jgi:hypothetical protein